MLRRTFLLLVLSSIVGARALLNKVVGWTDAELAGGSVGDGWVQRMVDPTTGVGVFTPNLNPAVTGIDPQTGVVAATGTDMGFGAAMRRYLQTNVINGDFSALPPLGASTDIVSDPGDANYNPLPGWYWTPPSNGGQSIQVVADSSYGSGYRLSVTTTISSSQGTLEQIIPIPISQGQQYRALVSMYGMGSALGVGLKYQYLKVDLTTIGSEVSATITFSSPGETKIDAGLVPPTAAYLRLRVLGPTVSAAASFFLAEVRCAFLPAEASVGLYTRTSDQSGSTTETVVATTTIPANTFVVGARYKVRISGLVSASASNAVTLRARVGPTTLTGTVVTTNGPSSTASAASNGFTWEATLTCRSVGATGTLYGSSFFVGSNTQPFTVPTGHSNNTGTSTIDTTVANLMEATIVSAAGTTTWVITDAEIVCERSA